MTPDKKRHVFLVDDNELFRKMTADILADKGWQLTECIDGPPAIETIAHLAPTLDVLLIDLVLPSMNGLQVLEFARQSPTTKHLPAVVLTGATPDAQMQADFQRLQAAHLDKGSVVESLGPMLDNLFSRLAKAGR